MSEGRLGRRDPRNSCSSLLSCWGIFMAVRPAQQELLTLSMPQMFLAKPIVMDGGVSRDVGRSSGRMIIDMVEHRIA